jgi:hypothetical protein
MAKLPESPQRVNCMLPRDQHRPHENALLTRLKTELELRRKRLAMTCLTSDLMIPLCQMLSSVTSVRFRPLPPA